MDYKVFTKGIDYSNGVRRTISRIEKSLDLSPSDSFCCACIEKTEKMFSGVVRIRSNVAQFGAVDAADDLDKLMSKLSGNLSAQLEAWRTQRFEIKESGCPSFADDQLIKLNCNPTTCPLDKKEGSDAQKSLGIPLEDASLMC